MKWGTVIFAGASGTLQRNFLYVEHARVHSLLLWHCFHSFSGWANLSPEGREQHRKFVKKDPVFYKA